MDAGECSTFLDAFLRWARSRTDIEAVALVGSHARGSALAGSDVDLVILTSHVDAYLRLSSWTNRFGDPISSRLEHYGSLTSLRVVYASGAEIEYGFARPDWAEVPADVGTFSVARDGLVSLWDPHGLLAALSHDVASRRSPACNAQRAEADRLSCRPGDDEAGRS